MSDLRAFLKDEYEKQLAVEQTDLKAVDEAARKFLRENAIALYRNPSVLIKSVWLPPSQRNDPTRGGTIEAKTLADYFKKYHAADFRVTEATKDNFQQDQSGTSWIEYFLSVKEPV